VSHDFECAFVVLVSFRAEDAQLWQEEFSTKEIDSVKVSRNVMLP
jgi:hypothetical protein